jgi:hypothetical protein
MIKNRNLQTGLLVFIATLIALIAFAQLPPTQEMELNTIEKTDLAEREQLDIAFH